MASAFAEADDAKRLLDRLREATGVAHMNVHDLDWTVRGKIWDGAGREAAYVTRLSLQNIRIDLQ